jgi:hypothetical protein
MHPDAAGLTWWRQQQWSAAAKGHLKLVISYFEEQT